MELSCCRCTRHRSTRIQLLKLGSLNLLVLQLILVSLGTSWAPSLGSLWRLLLICSNFWHYSHGVWITLEGELGQWVASGLTSYSTDLTHRERSSLKRHFFDLVWFDYASWSTLLCKIFIIWQEKKSTIYGCMYKCIYPNTIHFIYSKERLWNYLSVLWRDVLVHWGNSYYWCFESSLFRIPQDLGSVPYYSKNQSIIDLYF